MRLASHVLRVKNVVFIGQVFVVWIDFPPITTCILVEIDLQVYIFARKIGFTGPKVYFFSCRFLDGMCKSRRDAEILVVMQTLLVPLSNAICSHFFLSDTGVTIFFLTNL